MKKIQKMYIGKSESNQKVLVLVMDNDEIIALKLADVLACILKAVGE